MHTQRLTRGVGIAGAFMLVAILRGDILWDFADQTEVVTMNNLDPSEVSSGRLAGSTQWDPHITLKVPEGGINAQELTWLTVRLYSSTDADLLDIYYKSPDGRWCLGGDLPVRKGWAIYRMDLEHIHWRETRSGPGSKQWGGTQKRVAVFRIDPGNEMNRWIMIDYVGLQATAAGLEQGVVGEPMGSAVLQEFSVPKAAKAGESVKILARFDVRVPPGLRKLTGYTFLKQGSTVMRGGHRLLDAKDGQVTLESDFDLSPFWNPGALTVQIGFHELQMEQADAIEATIEFTNPAAAAAHPPKVSLERYGGDPAIVVNGSPISGIMYLSGGGVRPAYHQEAAAAGLHVYADWFGTSVASDLGHVTPDETTYGEFDQYFAAALNLDPDAYFLPHIGITAPHWWQRAHPEECCLFESGARGPSSFASERWKQDSGEDLRLLLRYLSQTPYAERIIGYCIYGGYTAEWQMWGTWQPSKGDYSEPAQKAFRTYLERVYRTNQALQIAWNQPEITFATARLAPWAQRRPEGPQLLRDPRRERPAIDFYGFINAMTAEAALYFAHIAREETRGRQLVGTYYAYLSAHGRNQQDSGHCEAATVFDSPDIDFLMSPPNYWYRKVGETSTFMSATDSLRMRGKLWLNESDCRTFLTDRTAGYGRTESLHDSLGVLWREFAEMLCKRSALSWFDMTGGWFSHPDLLSALGRTEAIASAYVPQRVPYSADIGVFVHPESFYWMRPSAAQEPLIRRQLALMPQAGAPFDYCLLDDIGKDWMPDYKLYVFLNAVHLTSAQRRTVTAKLKRNGAAALFLSGAGYFSDDVGSVANMAALTGITITAADDIGTAQAEMDPASPLTTGLVPGHLYGTEVEVSPLFAVDDPDAETIGVHPQTGNPVIASKRLDGWTSVYSAAFELPTAFIRNLARQAGVRIWLDTDDAIYSDGHYVGIHAATAGDKVILLPETCDRVVEVISGNAVTISRNTATLTMAFGDTVLLDLQPPP